MFIVLLKTDNNFKIFLTPLGVKFKSSLPKISNYLVKNNKMFLLFLIPLIKFVIHTKTLINFSLIFYYNFLFLYHFKYFTHQFNFCYFRLFKIHGINMRIIFLRKLLKNQLIFLRLAFSHGIILFLPKTVLFKIFKKRYLLLASLDLNYLNNLTYILKIFKNFFDYKLIGIKLLRDFLKIKIGKKKTI